MLGRKIIQIECCESTNNYAANLIASGKIEFGTVILADEQTKGKGQRGATWLSKPSENMLFSLYLDTANLSVNQQFVLTQFVSISVVCALGKFGVQADIKWPNDIYVKGKKMAGILIENQLQGSSIVGSIIGIGLNVNQIDFEGLNATSLKAELGSFTPVKDFVLVLIHEMNSYWKIVEAGNFELVKKYYLSYFWLLETVSNFRDSTGEFSGIIKDVEDNGLLRMERNGEIVTYDLKEISFIRY